MSGAKSDLTDAKCDLNGDTSGSNDPKATRQTPNATRASSGRRCTLPGSNTPTSMWYGPSIAISFVVAGVGLLAHVFCTARILEARVRNHEALAKTADNWAPRPWILTSRSSRSALASKRGRREKMGPLSIPLSMTLRERHPPDASAFVNRQLQIQNFYCRPHPAKSFRASFFASRHVKITDLSAFSPHYLLDKVYLGRIQPPD